MLVRTIRVIIHSLLPYINANAPARLFWYRLQARRRRCARSCVLPHLPYPNDSSPTHLLGCVVQVACVHEALCLIRHGSYPSGVTVAQRVDGNAGSKVQVLPAFVVPHLGTTAVREHDGRAAVGLRRMCVYVLCVRRTGLHLAILGNHCTTPTENYFGRATGPL